MRGNIFEEPSSAHVETEEKHRQGSRPINDRGGIPEPHPGVILSKVACAVWFWSPGERHACELPHAAGKVWIQQCNDARHQKRLIGSATENEQNKTHQRVGNKDVAISK